MAPGGWLRLGAGWLGSGARMWRVRQALEWAQQAASGAGAGAGAHERVALAALESGPSAGAGARRSAAARHGRRGSGRHDGSGGVSGAQVRARRGRMRGAGARGAERGWRWGRSGLGALFLGWSGRNAALAVVAAADTRCGSGNPAPVGSGRGKSFGGVLGHAVVLNDQLVGGPKP
jgi:hypothetical protein